MLSIKDFIPPIFTKIVRKIYKLYISNSNKILFKLNQKKDLSKHYLYYGNIGEHEEQFYNTKFIGLSLRPLTKRDTLHNAYHNLPCEPNSIKKIQSQDVFEHLEYEKIPSVLNSIYETLKPGGTFRLSVPDYNSPAMRKECVFDELGNIMVDISCGGRVIYDNKLPGKKALFQTDGNAHLWFPTYKTIKELISKSSINKSSKIIFYHYFIDRDKFVCDVLPENEMPVLRMPPNDMRSAGKPVSIIVDFIK